MVGKLAYRICCYRGFGQRAEIPRDTKEMQLYLLPYAFRVLGRIKGSFFPASPGRVKQPRSLKCKSGQSSLSAVNSSTATYMGVSKFQRRHYPRVSGPCYTPISQRPSNVWKFPNPISQSHSGWWFYTARPAQSSCNSFHKAFELSPSWPVGVLNMAKARTSCGATKFRTALTWDSRCRAFSFGFERVAQWWKQPPWISDVRRFLSHAQQLMPSLSALRYGKDMRTTKGLVWMTCLSHGLWVAKTG